MSEKSLKIGSVSMLVGSSMEMHHRSLSFLFTSFNNGFMLFECCFIRPPILRFQSLYLLTLNCLAKSCNVVLFDKGMPSNKLRST
uniref:Uncharacterized protein n=1 Tax=Arundo donax TaxID=35708 RepID=A0A0A8XY78_ARUDO